MRISRDLVCHVAAASIGISLTISAGLLLDRNPVVELDSARSAVSPNPAAAGDVVSITWNATARRNCDGIVIPRVIDSTGHIFEYARTPTVYQDIMRSGDHSFTKTLTLPKGMVAGPARYEAIVIRWCNSIQQYLWPMIDKPFPILFTVAPER